jgi:hypothetical protein
MKPRYAIVIALLIAAASAAAQVPSKTLALVNGEVITEVQVTTLAATELAALEAKKTQSSSTYERDRLVILHAALDSIIED